MAAAAAPLAAASGVLSMLQTAVETANSLVDIAVKINGLITKSRQKKRLTKLIPRLQMFAVYTRNLVADLVHYNGLLIPSLLEQKLAELEIRALTLKQFFLSYENVRGGDVAEYLEKSLDFLVGKRVDGRLSRPKPRIFASPGRQDGIDQQSESAALKPEIAALLQQSDVELLFLEINGLYTYFNAYRSLETRDEVIVSWIRANEATMHLVTPNPRATSPSSASVKGTSKKGKSKKGKAPLVSPHLSLAANPESAASAAAGGEPPGTAQRQLPDDVVSAQEMDIAWRKRNVKRV